MIQPIRTIRLKRFDLFASLIPPRRQLIGYSPHVDRRSPDLDYFNLFSFDQFGFPVDRIGGPGGSVNAHGRLQQSTATWDRDGPDLARERVYI